MAGVDVGGGGKGKRRSLDSEINMIPFIDLLMVTISFLLITAVWSHMSRINADAQVPGPPRPDVEETKTDPEKILHVEMRSPEKFTLIWKAGAQVVNSIEVVRKDDVKEEKGKKLVRYPDLATKIEDEWKTTGSHRDASDKKLDQAVLHTDNETQYMYLIGVIDAIYATHRKFTDQRSGKTDDVPAFNVTFAVN
jgi:biopolymer transport protein ExbD